MCQSLKNTSCRVHSAPGRAYIRYGRCAVCSVFVFCKVHLTCFPLYFINKNCIVFFPKIADLEFCKNLPLSKWQFASGFCFLFQVVVIDPTHGLSIQSMIFRSVSRPLYRKSFKSDAWRQPNRSLRAERS